mgnify:CR=1 FL=1
MTIKIILPKTYYEDKNYSDDPVFFLAGPIKGGEDWQQKCFNELKKHINAFTVVIPCTYDSNHNLFVYRVSGDENIIHRQTLWERYYLKKVAERKNGCIIFWLPCESKLNPRKDGSPYARDTYGELGEWRGRMINNPDLHIVIGAESGFPGLSQIQVNFNDALQKEFSILNSLQETVLAAIKITSIV